MITVEEALRLDDPNRLKRLRALVNTQITCDINLLNEELNKEQNGQFALSQMSEQLIKIQKEKLLLHFDGIQKVHDRYLVFRDLGDSDDAECLRRYQIHA